MSDELKEKKEKKPTPKQRLDSLEKTMSDLVGMVSELVQRKDTPQPIQTVTHSVDTTTLPSVTTTGSTSSMDEVKSEEMPIPPKWRAIVDEVLGTEFGIDVQYPDSGSGFKFTIIVPKEKSNASSSHWEMYKQDKRTVALDSNQGLDGIKRWCEKVKKNLETSKQ